MRWQIWNTWNGGEGGRKLVFTSTKHGDDGHNECFEWIHKSTPFSFSEATLRQGYSVETEHSLFCHHDIAGDCDPMCKYLAQISKTKSKVVPDQQ